jgi:hypothetical protein
MIAPTDQDWLALALVTESNRPEEWPFIAQVIENRVRSGRWGKSYRDVVLARLQFSAFNVFTDPPGDPHLGTRLMFGVMARREDALLLMHAAAFVEAGEPRAGLSGIQLWAGEISDATLHYFSPVSMKPPGSKPAWAATAKRLYTPGGVDPERFIFAEGVT